MTNSTKKVCFYFINISLIILISSCSLMAPCNDSPELCKQRNQLSVFMNQMSSDQAAQSAATQMHTDSMHMMPPMMP